MTKSEAESKLNQAREVAGRYEFGTPEWDAAIVEVYALTDYITSTFPPTPWTDKEWSEMMSR